MLNEICVIGYPSYCGGADTELLDQIKLWSKIGLKTIIIPTSDPKDNINLSEYNTSIEEIKAYKECAGKHVISFCNPHFLNDIHEIRKYAKTITWVNCMCFNFKEEIEAHKNGYIDYFLYQTKHQYDRCAPRLMYTNSKFNIYHIKPWFDTTKFPFIEDRNEFFYGRISRSSLSKFNKHQFEIYRNIHFNAKGIVLGWSKDLEDKRPDENVKYLKDNNLVTFYKEREISQQEFYKKCSAICMTTDTFENYPRVAFEAMSSGTVLIVDNRGGWKELIEDKKTGFLCDEPQEFSFWLDNLIMNRSIVKEIAKNARAKLETDFSYEKSVSSWTNFFELLCSSSN